MAKEKKENIIPLIIQMIEDKKEEFKNLFGIPFNFYPQTVRRLEQELDEMYPFGERQVIPQMVAMFGVYLGETIRRNIRSKDMKVYWKENEEYLLESVLCIEGVKEVKETVELKPLLRAHKFLNVDRTDSMWTMYCLTLDMVNGRISLGEEKIGKWQQKPRGYQFRAMHVDKKEDADW